MPTRISEADYPDHPVFVNIRKRIPREILASIAGFDARLSGSIILQAYYGEDWKSDVDIYECVTTDYAKRAGANVFSDLENMFYGRLGATMDSFVNYDYSDYDPYLRIAQTRSYKFEDNTYQIIGVANCESEKQFEEFLRTVFDFPICKNYIQFVGLTDSEDIPTVTENIWGQKVDTLMTLWMDSPEDVANRKTRLQFGIRPCETLMRVQKYRKRGIEVVDDGTVEPPVVRIPAVFVKAPPGQIHPRMCLMPRSPVLVNGSHAVRNKWFNEGNYLSTYSRGDPRCKTCPYNIVEPHVHVFAQVDYGKMREIEYVLTTTNDPVW